jgi:lipid A 3-O-deacylase
MDCRVPAFRRPTTVLVAVFAACALPLASAAAEPSDTSAKRQVFVQAGTADEARAHVVGVTWALKPLTRFAGGDIQLYWEASFGRWTAEQDANASGSAWITQLGITPVFRWQPDAGSSRWFVEAAIGAHVILPVYRSREKRFSTTFNFGDHLAIGRQFGDDLRHELALRIQHFSNAGIRRPNPGENFIQLRYAARF